jgi:hypothetical protein
MTNLAHGMNHLQSKVLTFLFIAVTLACAVDVPKSAAQKTTHSGVKTTKKFSDVIPFCLIAVAATDLEGHRGWMAMSPENTGEADGNTAAELIQYFNKLPQQRKKQGIYIWSSITHLKDAKVSKAHMSELQVKSYADPSWLEADRRYVAELATACNKAGVSLWVNTVLGGTSDNIEFQKLTK